MSSCLLHLVILLWVPYAASWTLKPYNPKPNPSGVVQTKTTRFTIFTSNMIRMEYSPSGIFEDRASKIFVNRYTDPPQFTVQNGSTIVISTPDLHISYKGGPFSASSLSISGNVDGIAFTYVPSGNTDTDNGWSNNLFGTILGLDRINGDFSLNCTENADHSIDGYKHPHCQWAMFGTNGYAVIDDTNTTMMDDHWFSSKPNANQQDIYFFGHGHNYKQALHQYTRIAGSIPLIPRYGLGSLHTRWYHYSDQSFRGMITQYQSRSIPLDLAILDMDWHYLDTTGKPWGAYSWSDLLFPNANITMTWVHRVKGLRAAANLHDAVGIQTIEKYYSQAAARLGVTNGKDILPNISDYEYMMTVQDVLISMIEEPAPSATNKALQHGFDVWWIDWQQGMTGIHLNDKITPTFILSYVRGTNNIRKKQNIRNMVLARCGGYGNHRYPVGFSGDQAHTWESLQYNTYFTPTAANVLFAWSHDIYGSQHSDDLALNTRWIQFGAYSPIFRIHDKGQGTGGCGLNSIGCALPDIWTHPYQYYDIERQALIERSELLPYIYNAYYAAYTTGLQLVRSMYIDYPSDTNAYPIINPTVRKQYMFGDAMIVSPIADPQSGLFNVTQQDIYLPFTHDFYEKHSGYMIQKQSAKAMYRNFSLVEIPIYIVSNAIIPNEPWSVDHVLGKANKPSYERLRFDIYPPLNVTGAGGSTVLYEDDGITLNYLNANGKDVVRTTVNWTYDDSSFQFVARIVSNGSYDGFAANRPNSVRIYNVLSPKYVACNGQQVDYNVLYFDEYAKQNTYYFNALDMALTVNCPNVSTSTRTEIEIKFARDWSADFKYTALYGMKGRISRAKQCKDVLDEVNYVYGKDSGRSNMTLIASYGMLLGNIGNDYQAQFDCVQQFDMHWKLALNEVKQLNAKTCGTDRYNYCNDLFNTITI